MKKQKTIKQGFYYPESLQPPVIIDVKKLETTKKENPVVAWDIIVKTKDGKTFLIPEEYEMPTKLENWIGNWIDGFYDYEIDLE